MGSLIDLSQEIYEGMPVYAGHLETKVWQHHRHEDTAPNFESDFSYQSLGITVCDHGPTHVDAFSHLDPRAGRADDRRDGPRHLLGRRDVPRHLGRPAASSTRPGSASTARSPSRTRTCSTGDVLLLRTGTAERLGGTPEYTSQYPGLDQSAADWLGDHKVKIFGVDSPSPDNPADKIYPVHLFCRENRITHYENLANLEAVVGRRFRFFGFPLRIRGGHGSPVRAVAMLHD